MNNRPDHTSSKAKKPSHEPSHPGMLGDGTEEQNLNQPGDPKARITKDEVEDAFEKAPTAKK